MQTKSNDSRVAIVTGASRGIGAEIACRLASDGFMVGIHYGRAKEAALAVQQQIQAADGEAFIFCSDLGQPDAAQRFYSALDTELEARRGNHFFDVLVNNAGVAPLGTVKATTPEQFDEIFAVNVKATFFIAQGAMTRINDGGRIINLSSTMTRLTVSGAAAYSMSKAAINVLTRMLALDLGRRNICVNAVAPGVTVTEMSAQLLAPPGTAEATAKMNAIPRLGQASDIAGVVSFLSSSDSGWVTGQVIEASGGTRL